MYDTIGDYCIFGQPTDLGRKLLKLLDVYMFVLRNSKKTH